MIRDLVTDVSFNYKKARQIPAFAPPEDLAPGDYRMQQVDVERSQEFRKCIECFLCQDTCHVVRDHEENKEAFAGPRFLIRAAELDMHPLDARDDRKDFAAGRAGHRACATSPSAAPRSAPSTSRSPTTRIIPMKERVVDRQVRPAGVARREDRPAQELRRCSGGGQRPRATTVQMVTLCLTWQVVAGSARRRGDRVSAVATNTLPATGSIDLRRLAAPPCS